LPSAHSLMACCMLTTPILVGTGPEFAAGAAGVAAVAPWAKAAMLNAALRPSPSARIRNLAVLMSYVLLGLILSASIQTTPIKCYGCLVAGVAVAGGRAAAAPAGRGAVAAGLAAGGATGDAAL